MEQIYYTQCPVGYGLGASNGFQIKRITTDYPVGADFRHLSIRPFLPNTKALAPAVLRYRRDGETAEIAWLTPRSHEYQTERGRLWGRPGGQFAHGLRLDAAEFSALHHWPSALLGHADWVESDPEPTRGRRPEPFRPEPSARFPTASFSEVAPLAARFRADVLAKLLAEVAASVRDNRTLFVIDRPERLADLVALLTFAFPEEMRDVLTFSTYHERAEELIGFRIQGTSPESRPNLAALQSLGTVVDVSTDSAARPPSTPAPAWAARLAAWFVDGGQDAAAAWTRVCRALASRIDWKRLGERIWSDDWLDGFFAFDAAISVASDATDSTDDWNDFRGLTAWAARSGVTNLWSEARGASWWLERAPDEQGEQAWNALAELLQFPGSWSESFEVADAWGRAVARHMPGDLGAAAPVLTAIVAKAPAKARGAFLLALTRALPSRDASDLLDHLASGDRLPPALLLPSRAREAVDAVRERDDFRPLLALFEQAFPLNRGLIATLGALVEECASDQDLTIRCASSLAAQLPLLDSEKRRAVLVWMNTLPTFDPWIRSWAERLFNDEEYVVYAEELHNALPNSPVTRLMIDSASSPSLDGNRFVWAVERILLRLSPSNRPHDPSWPGKYLDRERSGISLMRKLYNPAGQDLRLKKWIDRAREEGELSQGRLNRVSGLRNFVKSLANFDGQSLINLEVPEAEPLERGPFLDEMLRCLGGGSRQGFGLCLEAAFVKWPHAFEPSAEGLPGLAAAVARAVPLEPGAEPERWRKRIDDDVIPHLHLHAGPLNGWEPDGFLAELVAAVCAAAPTRDAWALRNNVFRDEEAWKSLMVDVRWGLAGTDWEMMKLALESWDQEISKGLRTAKFYELLLNAAGPAALLAVASSRAGQLAKFDRLKWWDRATERAETADVRDRFARRVVLAPPPSGALPFIQTWLRRCYEDRSGGLVPIGGPENYYSERDPRPYLSALGAARWNCIEALPKLTHATSEADRWIIVQNWKPGAPPLRDLPDDDRYSFIASVISALDGPPSHYEVALDAFAAFVKDARALDLNRINNWHSEWRDPVHPTPTDNMLRLELVSSLRRKLAGEGARKTRA